MAIIPKKNGSGNALDRFISFLPYCVLVLLFILLHYNVFFRGYYRPHGDHTLIHYSVWYFMDGIFSDVEIPLWQPYRHFGTLNVNTFILFNPVLIILGQLYLWIGKAIGINSFSMYKITFLSYITGYILTFAIPLLLVARDIIKSARVRCLLFAACLFGTHLYLMLYLGLDLLFYFPLSILFWTRLLKDPAPKNTMLNLIGLFLSIALTITNSIPGYVRIVVTVYIIICLSSLLSSDKKLLGIPFLYCRIRDSLIKCSKAYYLLASFGAVTCLGLGALRIAIFFTIDGYEAKNRAIVQTKAALLNAVSSSYVYSNHIFSIIDNLYNIFSWNTDALLPPHLPVPMLYFGFISIIIFILMFREIENKRILYFCFLSAVFILICSTHPKDGYNYILPFSYLLNPFYSMGTRHDNLIILFAFPFTILILCMALDTYFSRYTFAAFARHQKAFIFLTISSFAAYFVYGKIEGFYPKTYVYWYAGIIFAVLSVLLYFPRERLYKPDILLPFVMIFLILLEMAIPMKDYFHSFFVPFTEENQGYWGDNLPVKESIRGLPIPMNHSFAFRFNKKNVNTTNNIYYRINNAYFKFLSIGDFDDTTFIEKNHSLESMPWLKRFSEHIQFVTEIMPVADAGDAFNLTKALCDSDHQNRIAVVEGSSSDFSGTDITLTAADALNEDHRSEGAKTPAPIFREVQLIKSNFRYIGNDATNSAISLYEARLPEAFPKYLTTNYLNKDYTDIKVVGENNQIYIPTYFDQFQHPFRFQINYLENRIVIASTGDIPNELNIRFRNRFEEIGIEIDKFSYNTLSMNSFSDHDRFMIYFDRNNKNWQFFIDGARAKIFNTNSLFKGVIVPEGKHRLLFKYSAPLLTSGFIIYAASVFAAILLLVTILWLSNSKPKCRSEKESGG